MKAVQMVVDVLPVVEVYLGGDEGRGGGEGGRSRRGGK